MYKEKYFVILVTFVAERQTFIKKKQELICSQKRQMHMFSAHDAHAL